MWLRLAASAAVSLAACVCARAQAREVLSLDDAFARVGEAHPDLRAFGARLDGLLAEKDGAALRPALQAGAQLENAFGSGAVRGLDGAELTLTLSSVLERGGKLDARRALAQQRIDALAVEREARRLDLLADVARRYLDIVAAGLRRSMAADDVAQRQRVVDEARRRLHAGASPASVVLSAQAVLARAELERDREALRTASASRHLAALWGERDPDFDVAGGDPRRLEPIADLATLRRWLDATPELAAFASEQRVREARLQLARSEGVADVQWQLGVRRLQAGADAALVGSVSIPLGARQRAEPGVRAADAELARLDVEREAKGLSLYATLVDAHARYAVAQAEVDRLGRDVLPLLAQAEAAAQRAFRAGAATHFEWAQAQSELVAARRQQLDAALDGQRALIEIQRLTGQPFAAAASTHEGTRR